MVTSQLMASPSVGLAVLGVFAPGMSLSQGFLCWCRLFVFDTSRCSSCASSGAFYGSPIGPHPFPLRPSPLCWGGWGWSLPIGLAGYDFVYYLPPDWSVGGSLGWRVVGVSLPGDNARLRLISDSLQVCSRIPGLVGSGSGLGLYPDHTTHVLRTCLSWWGSSGLHLNLRVILG
jgi:hypothetical protein